MTVSEMTCLQCKALLTPQEVKRSLICPHCGHFHDLEKRPAPSIPGRRSSVDDPVTVLPDGFAHCPNEACPMVFPIARAQCVDCGAYRDRKPEPSHEAMMTQGELEQLHADRRADVRGHVVQGQRFDSIKNIDDALVEIARLETELIKANQSGQRVRDMLAKANSEVARSAMAIQDLQESKRALNSEVERLNLVARDAAMVLKADGQPGLAQRLDPSTI